MASIDWNVRTHLQRYLLGEEILRAFQRWFTPIAWRETDHQSASKLVRTVALFLAEYTSGHRSEPELRNLFLEQLAGTASPDLSETQDWSADKADFAFSDEPVGSRSSTR